MTNIDNLVEVEDIEIDNTESSKDHDWFLPYVDDKSPVIFFVGPAFSGKSMALIRLIRYLETKRFKVVPDANFRPSDPLYIRWCNEFAHYIYNDNWAPGHSIWDPLLVKIINPQGRTEAKIIDIPGDAFIRLDGNESRRTYLDYIFRIPKKRVWVFFVEQDSFLTHLQKAKYVQKINDMHHRIISGKDRVVFLFSKADRFYEQYDRNGHPVKKLFVKNITQEYPNIFLKYQNFGLKKFLHGTYNFQSVVFSAGDFHSMRDGNHIWTSGRNVYCENLWKTLSKCL